MCTIKFIHFKVEGHNSNLKVDTDKVDWCPVVGELVTIKMADGKIFSGKCISVHINYVTATMEITITPKKVSYKDLCNTYNNYGE